MTHSPMSQNRVRDALELIRPIFKDKRRIGLSWNSATAEEAFEQIEAALTAPPASDAAGAEEAVAEAINKARYVDEDGVARGLPYRPLSESGPTDRAYCTKLARAALAAAPTAPAQAPSRPVDAGGVEAEADGRAPLKVRLHTAFQFLEGLDENSAAGQRHALNPIITGSMARISAKAFREALATQAPDKADDPRCASKALPDDWLEAEIAKSQVATDRWSPGLRASFEMTHGPLPTVAQAPDKAGAREGLVALGAAACIDVWMGGDRSWRTRDGDGPSQEFMAGADWEMAVKLTTAVLDALATQPTGTEASRPVGGGTEESPRLSLAQGIEDGLKARGYVTLDNSDWKMVTEALRASPTLPQADSTGQGADIPQSVYEALTFVYRGMDKIEEIAAFAREHTAYIIRSGTPSQADAQTQEGGR